VIMLAESYEIHAETLRERPEDYGILSMKRTILGSALTVSDYIRARRLRRELAQKVNAVWKRYDAIITVGNKAPALRLDPSRKNTPSSGPHAVFNISGSPALAVPVGLSEGLPISVTIGTAPFDEVMALRVGRAVERLSGWQAIELPDL
jgi:aspartyl-tRNA(Asn)/glutamyl-tRNA(Gln) amidotransferase subunit A